MHIDISQEFGKMLKSKDGEKLVLAAPRGNAKTTFLLAFILYCICYGKKRFIIYITSTAELANTFLGDLKAELEDNPRIRADYPDVAGRGPHWLKNVIITNNGIRVQPLGAGKKIRGRKHRQYRPDLVMVDDFEDDEHIRNKDQRDKNYNWLTKAVLNVGGPGVKTDFVCSGTLLHFDSVVSRLLDAKQSPGWNGKVYKAVMSWSERKDLWDKWEEIYTNWRLSSVERKVGALAFFEENRRDMLEGTEVLWPEGEPYYDLMCQRVDKGPAAFQSEKQNEPIDPSSCEFPEEWFTWFDEVEENGTTWLVPDLRERVKLSECDIYGACDPSKGKADKHGDPSAIITLAAWPSQNLPNFEGRYSCFFILDAIISWIHPHDIEERILELHKRRKYERFGYESVQFQELHADSLQERSLKDQRAESLRVVKLLPKTDKKLRIQKMGPYIYAKKLVFARNLSTLYDQFRYFPQHAHDDGPDAVELALETIGEIGWVMVNDPIKVKTESLPFFSIAGMAETRPDIMGEFVDKTLTCGSCSNFSRIAGEDVEGVCDVHVCKTDRTAIACEFYSLVDDKS